MRRAKLSALVLALVLLIAYVVVNKTSYYLKFDGIDMVNILYAVLPLSLLTILIAVISCHLRHVQRSRKKIMQGHSSPRSLLATTPSTTLVPASRQNSVANLASGTPASHMVVPPQRSPTTLQNIAHFENSLTATLVPESRQNSVANVALGTSASHIFVPPQRNPTTLQDIARLENSVTAMMLVATVCFFLLTMPLCAVLYAVKYSWRIREERPVANAYWNLLFQISLLLAVLNASINFILYFLSVKKFRLQLYRILKGKLRSIRG
ncbi:hypothetical protein PoB_000173900 [Plakobranchus ocellatus]|uniref:G-protein coupled receptors family 1 profile domain-containing protein n=1 Tax=Plakobranchus ocellatus TaxID=259542 RepID=A0AAV3XZT3_9GAST|nr:hypothetical protein PoB_000173900 [Plakobranchus ocellatus]